MQQQITVTAPKGAEFGKTEVIYLAVMGPSRDEALHRTTVVCDQLEVHLGRLRRARAEGPDSGIGPDRTNRRSLAGQCGREVCSRWKQRSDRTLARLRNLNDAGSAEGNLQHSLNQVKAELRQAQGTREANLQLQKLLTRAKETPAQFLATPGRLLESQPALRRLKEGLVDAQLKTSALLGLMKEEHPMAIAAVRAEEQIRRSLVNELSTALRGVEADLQVGERLAQTLRDQKDELQGRLDALGRCACGIPKTGRRLEAADRDPTQGETISVRCEGDPQDCHTGEFDHAFSGAGCRR